MQTLERRELLAADFGLLTSADDGADDGNVAAVWSATTSTAPSSWSLAGLVAEGEGEPLPINDTYQTREDEPLVVDATSPQLPLLANDQNLTGHDGVVVYSVVNGPQRGALQVLNHESGSFRYVPNAGQNGSDSFTYALAVVPANWQDLLVDDDGQPTGIWDVWFAGEPGIDYTVATVDLSISAVNDPPQFDVAGPGHFAEQHQSQQVVWSNVLENILPGRPVSTDEQANQQVTVELVAGSSTIPATLFAETPQLVPRFGTDGNLTAVDVQFVPQAGQWGTAQLVLSVSDNDADDPQSRLTTVTLNVHPVNTPPIANPAVLGQSDERGDDQQYRVSTPSTAGQLPIITYTMAEDGELLIPVRRPVGVVGYNAIGILDVVLPGPANEIAPGPGGSQTTFIQWALDDDGQPVELTSEQGGQLTPVYSGGELVAFRYRPRQDFNSALGIIDRLPAFRVTDRSADGLESWDPLTGQMISDPQTSLVTVQIAVNPVNDRPQFDLNETTVNVHEDSGTYRYHLFATNVFAGPPESAFDELNQVVTFSLTAVNPGAEALFARAPEIGDAASGWSLTFTPEAQMYGTAVFEVRATDDGPDNTIRGDLVSSLPQYLTINIRPVNDRPTLIPGASLAFNVNEDAMVLRPGGTLGQTPAFIPLRGTAGQSGLLDVFTAGPSNETSPTASAGNQQVLLGSSFPVFTVHGGRLQPVYAPGAATELIGYHYFPKAHFNGEDSFIYGVIDNGVSAELDGTLYADPQTAFNTVRLNVLPLNDPPQFSGPVSVTVLEDSIVSGTVGVAVIPQFVTEIMAGPAGALDELHPLTGQTVAFTVTPVAGNPANLFSVPPQVSADGTLTFRAAADANGRAVFTISATDNGPSNPPLELRTSTTRTFTITVQAVNDSPTFTQATDQVTVAEDSGPFTSPDPVAANISPGPADEVAAGQTVRFEVIVPDEAAHLFQVLPTVTDSGFLRFTPAEHAVGSTVVSLVAIDSDDARSAPVNLTIQITEVNDVPSAGLVSLISDEDSLLHVPLDTLIDAAFDPDLQTNPDEHLSVVELATTSQAGATVRLTADGVIEYDPSTATLIQALRPGQTMVDTFSYRIQDAAGATSNVGHVSITLSGINDAPIVVDDLVPLSTGATTTIDPLANDMDVDGSIDRSTLRVDVLPAFGTVVQQPNGTLVYTPFPNFRGTDSLAYSVADDLGLRSQLAWVTIQRNTPPIALADQAQTYWGESVDINVLANDSDPDGPLDRTSVEIITHPLRGGAVVLPGGVVRYVPNADFSGTDTFQYTVRDTEGQLSVPAEVRVQVLSSRLQNPGNRFDVNASGQVSPLDALLILNRLSAASRTGQSASLPVEDLLDERPVLYYDVNGDRQVGLLDALLVINELSRLSHANRPSAEGESAAIAAVAASPIESTSPLSATVASESQSVDGGGNPLADFETTSDVFAGPGDDALQLIAADGRDSSTQRQPSDRQSELDSVMAQWDLSADF